MKTKAIILLAMLTVSAMFTAAQGNNHDWVTEPRSSKPYHYIHIKGEMNVKLVQNETPGVTVKGSAYQVENTITWLHNDTLFVYQANTRMSDGKVSVIINAENISLLEVSGQTSVDCSGLINTDFLTIRAYDGARIKVDIRALKVDSKATGCSFINVSGTVGSKEESTDACGIIDSQNLDVMSYKRNVIISCFGGC